MPARRCCCWQAELAAKKQTWIAIQTDANFICQANPNVCEKMDPLNFHFTWTFLCFFLYVVSQLNNITVKQFFRLFSARTPAWAKVLWGIVWLDFPAFICVKVAKFMLYGAEILIRKLANLALLAMLERSSSSPPHTRDSSMWIQAGQHARA